MKFTIMYTCKQYENKSYTKEYTSKQTRTHTLLKGCVHYCLLVYDNRKNVYFTNTTLGGLTPLLTFCNLLME